MLKIEFVRRKKGATGGDVWESLGSEWITVDSGAEESVCPLGWGAEFGMQAVPPGKEMRMLNAGGGEMKHFGSRRVSFTGVVFKGGVLHRHVVRGYSRR